MRDAYGDAIRVGINEDGATFSAVTVSCHDSEGDLARAVLSAKKARKLAKKLLAAADELDDAQGRDLGPKHEERITHLERESRVAARAVIAQDVEIAKLRVELHWDREQITALLADLGDRQAKTEDDPTEAASATAVDEDFHYLLPRSWILDHSRHLNTSKPGRVVFEIPAGTRLADRAWDGRNAARKIRGLMDDLVDALSSGPDRVSPSAYAGTFRPLLERLYDAVGGA